jgi:hypothetical protein
MVSVSPSLIKTCQNKIKQKYAQKKRKEKQTASQPLTRIPPQGFRQANSFFEDYGVWKEAPVLIGTTKFEPREDVKNIMITGGAGFM